MTFKILTGRPPQYLEKLFSVSQNGNYNLRSKLPKPNQKQIFSKVFRTGLQSPGTNFQVEPPKITTIFTTILSFKRQLLNSHIPTHCN